ncbi:MAG: glycosyltransferase family 2 protein [Planctomycetaceae bacterium]|nr:glycosyltransferase family 2 protein [Planctomycetaceae bacterium]
MAMSVSVVLPTRDRPEALGRAVRSILDQPLRPLELIVVDNGTVGLAPELGDEARRAGVEYCCLRYEPPSTTATRNLGLERARGDIVLLFDDDQIMPGGFLQRLVALYEQDAAGVIDGIGGLCRQDPRGLGGRLWSVASCLAGECCWRPRVQAARYVRLPAPLGRQLSLPRWISGGAISLRREAAAAERFDETMTGYAYSEDREFCFRVGRRRRLFLAADLQIIHDNAQSRSGDSAACGRRYVRNSLHVAATAMDRGAGTWLLVMHDFIGTMLLHALWGAALGKRWNLGFARGMAAEMCSRAAAAVRDMWGGDSDPARGRPT